jgi:hypothetical protein
MQKKLWRRVFNISFKYSAALGHSTRWPAAKSWKESESETSAAWNLNRVYVLDFGWETESVADPMPMPTNALLEPVIQVLMVVSWVIGLVAFGLFVSPECRMAFISYTWDSRHCKAGQLVPLLEFIVLDPIMLGTFVAYLVILWIIVAQVTAEDRSEAH